MKILINKLDLINTNRNANTKGKRMRRYMFKKIFLSILIIISMMMTNSVNASTISNEEKVPTISKTYTEGFYSFNNKTNVDIGITLLDDTPTKIIILDEDMDIEFMSSIPYNYKFYLRTIEPGKIIAIVGKGKVALTFEQSK